MSLEPGFRFSQSSLAAYTTCPRSFALRYIHKLSWPAVASEPVLERERHLEIGSRFHLLVQQYLAGMPPENISRTAYDDVLKDWWKKFLFNNPVEALTGKKLVEYTLSTRILGYPLDAKYDLLVIHPDQSFTICDWKTNKVIPSREILEKNLQTMVYRLVLAQAGHLLAGGYEPMPEKIRMMYWFVEYPDQPVELMYTPAALENDRLKLTKLVEEINSLPLDAFGLTSNVKLCELCQYRSYCDRGIGAGNWDTGSDTDETGSLLDSLNLDDIGEIAF
jgi:CRISPR/Cas system-associated exonuclease Cas4 (RecB family)